MERSERDLYYAERLAQMIRVRTVSTLDMTDFSSFDELQDLLRSLFPTLFSVCEFESYNKGFSLMLKGKDRSRKPLLFLNHQDVVPAGDGWTFGPFDGTVSEGKLWGRGTLDDKGGLFCMLQAAEELVKEGFVPPCDFWFESSCCEEVGFEDRGCALFSREMKKRGISFEASLDEGGMIVEAPIRQAKGRFAMIGVSEKATVNLRFTARSDGGHASVPHKNSPLVRLGSFMSYVDSHEIFEISMSDTVCEMFTRFGRSADGVLGFLLSHTRSFRGLITKVMTGIPSARAMLGTTIAFTQAKGSPASNVMPSCAYVVANMRCSSHEGVEKSIERITKVAGRFGLETLVIERNVQSPVSDYKTVFFEKITQSVQRCYEGVVCTPYIPSGASDSRFLSEICDNSYRFVPLMASSQQVDSVHAIDENVDVSTLSRAVDFYRTLMEIV